MLLTSWLASLKSAFPVHTRRIAKRSRGRRSLQTVSYASLQSLEERVLLSAVNNTPAAQTFNINVTEDLGPQLITLGGDDGDPQFIQQLTYSIFTNPSHGTLSSFNATAGTVLYTPAPNYFGPDSFTYKVADDGATVLSLQGTVNGSLTVPGQSDQFTFTLGARTNVYFDTLTNDPYLTWTLKGADIDITESFTNSDWNTNDAVRSLPAGSYTLRVDRDGDSVGPYQFRLIDLSTATPLQLPLGTPTNGTLNPTNETDFYKFSATAGQKIYLDSISLTGDATNAYWRLVDPYGNFVPGVGNYMGADIGEVTIPVSGTYTVLIEGYPADGGVSGSYSFNVVPINNPAPQALTLGSTVNGNIPSPGQTDTYTFTLGTSARLYMDTLVNDSNVLWSLKGPAVDAITGNLETPDWYSGNPVLNLPAGSYTLTMRRDNGATGTYKFRLLDLAANAESTALGATLTRTLSPENETDVYTFTTVAGNQFNIDYQSSTGAPNAYWRLIDPQGNVVSGTNVPIYADFGPIVSTYGGTYTLLLEGAPFDSGASGSYTFSIPQLSNVVIPPVTGTNYTLNSTQPGTISAPGEIDDYKFTIPAGPDVLVYMDGQTYDSSMYFKITGPSGTFENYLYASDWYSSYPVMKLAPGTYKLSLSGSDGGGYQFNLRTLASATPLTLPLGTPVTGTLSPVSETDLYSFDGTAGAQYYFDADSITGDIGSAYWRLIDPYGQVVSGASNNVNGGDFGPITLPSTGKYTIAVEGYPFQAGASGDYTINVIPVVNPAPQAVTFGTPIDGNTTTPGQVDTYTFSLLSDTKVYLDTLSNESNVLWSLKGPVTTNFNYLYGTDWYSSDPVMTLPAGDYTLTMKRDSGAVGTYKFRLLDLTSATPLTPGTPVNGTLNPSTETDLYNFDGTAGAVYYFDSSAITGDIGSAYWRLIDPYGQPVPGATNNVNAGDFGPITLPLTGKYTVLVEGYPFQGGVSGGYTINVVPVVNPAPQALTFDGNTINGNIVMPGQSDAYTFTLGAESKLYLDTLTSDGSVYWTLKGPAGTSPTNPIYASDWYSANPVMTLPAGDYTLTITRYLDSTGPYKFRLLNMATNAESITPGTPLTRTLTPENETDIYTFSATAGNRFNFIRSVTGAPNAYWRLIDPFGNVVPSTNVPLSSDFGPITITYSGTYTLLVEGYVNDVGASASYTFNVVPLSNVVIPPVSGALMNLDTSLVNSTISAPGEIDNYKFVIPAGPDVLVYVDGQTDDSNMHWTITGPSGTFSNYFTNSDWSNSTPFLKLAAGTYKLSVDGSGSTGSYKFKVRTIGSAVSLPVAGTTSTLNPANETDLYYLDAVAGEQYYFDASAITGAIGNAAWRLIDPYGKPVPNASSYVNYGDFGPITIPTSGRYTVLVEGYPYEITSGGYTIKAWKVQNLPPAPLTSPAATANITVLNVNDAPVLDNTGDMTLPAINEDAFTNTGTTIAGLIASAGGNRITDVDNDPEGIAVTAAPASGGTWQYTLDGGTNWLPVGTVSGTSALLLPDTAQSRIRFVPLTNFNGSRSIQFRAWDRTSGTAGSKVDVSTNGGATAFSTAIESASVTVNAVNDSPVIHTAGSPKLTDIPEDAFTSIGTSITDILANGGVGYITDADTGAAQGMAVYAAPNSGGTWQYTTNNGGAWANIGAVTPSAALLLASDGANTRIRFVPLTNFNGTRQFYFRAWDQTSGTNGSTANLSPIGGITAFSSNADSATVTVTPVNDAPLLFNAQTPTLGSMSRLATNHPGIKVTDLIASAGAGYITDQYDAGALQGITIYNAQNIGGKWQYTVNGVNWFDMVGSTNGPLGVGTASALLDDAHSLHLPADTVTRVRFVPDGTSTGDRKIFFRAWDRTNAVTAGTKADSSVRGGTTAYSVAADSATLTVNTQNDAPVLNPAGTPALPTISNTNTNPAGISILDLIAGGGANYITDLETSNGQGIAIYGAPSSGGTWQYSLDNGGTWINVGTVNADIGLGGSLLLKAVATTKIRFKPLSTFTGTRSISFAAWDQTTGTEGTKVDTQDANRGGSTAFSVARDTAAVIVTA